MGVGVGGTVGESERARISVTSVLSVQDNAMIGHCCKRTDKTEQHTHSHTVRKMLSYRLLLLSTVILQVLFSARLRICAH